MFLNDSNVTPLACSHVSQRLKCHSFSGSGRGTIQWIAEENAGIKGDIAALTLRCKGKDIEF
ncbi:MAG: hypothetical protein DSM106950_42685 [Stigonema ocellatum SAG 48.90 = DSM 106950]|nr:hypothetical protein [Stigonema ocellatum SAG 48.90 = DSM 106950]